MAFDRTALPSELVESSLNEAKLYLPPHLQTALRKMKGMFKFKEAGKSPDGNSFFLEFGFKAGQATTLTPEAYRYPLEILGFQGVEMSKNGLKYWFREI